MILESDCLPVVLILNSLTRGSSHHHLICEDILSLAKEFNVVSSSYVRRYGNATAHSIAKLVQANKSIFL